MAAVHGAAERDLEPAILGLLEDDELELAMIAAMLGAPGAKVGAAMVALHAAGKVQIMEDAGGALWALTPRGRNAAALLARQLTPAERFAALMEETPPPAVPAPRRFSDPTPVPEELVSDTQRPDWQRASGWCAKGDKRLVERCLRDGGLPHARVIAGRCVWLNMHGQLWRPGQPIEARP